MLTGSCCGKNIGSIKADLRREWLYLLTFLKSMHCYSFRSWSRSVICNRSYRWRPLITDPRSSRAVLLYLVWNTWKCASAAKEPRCIAEDWPTPLPRAPSVRLLKRDVVLDCCRWLELSLAKSILIIEINSPHRQWLSSEAHRNCHAFETLLGSMRYKLGNKSRLRTLSGMCDENLNGSHWGREFIESCWIMMVWKAR